MGRQRGATEEKCVEREDNIYKWVKEMTEKLKIIKRKERMESGKGGQ